MDIVTTSLDALLQRATNPQNQNIDTAAVEAFCALVNKEKDGSYIGVKLLASRIHSQNEKEVLQTLHILDICMQRCSSQFQGEVGKFRFLNEMIKLVSPKYLGSQTPLSVRQKVLQLMYLWTLDYPKETKIKEAYDMLKKQGVIREVPLSDEEKSKLLQKLLQSKNPEDLQAANRLIKSMVKEDDRRAELKSKRISDLESIQNNVCLLNEMLDSYRPNVSSKDELELINELHQVCERLRPGVIKLVTDPKQDEESLNDALQASYDLGDVHEKYVSIIVQGKVPQKVEPSDNGLSLLDLNVAEPPNTSPDATVEPNNLESDYDVLRDIFTTNNPIPTDDILQPVPVKPKDADIKNSKTTGFEDLDALGEHLLRENLQSSARQGSHFHKPNEKIPMNLLSKQNQDKHQNETKPTLSSGDSLNLDLSVLLDSMKLKDDKLAKPIAKDNGKTDNGKSDDLLVDISENLSEKDSNEVQTKNSVDVIVKREETVSKESTKKDLKLNDIFVKLEDIKPSSIPPIVALEEKNGITVTLHFAKEKPREDVSVVVVTIVSRNECSLKNVLFRAIVPKSCKVKLQPASGTEFPPFNPFLPPSAITQVMLISNPDKISTFLKFIVSYNIDEETTTEMGEIEDLPIFH